MNMDLWLGELGMILLQSTVLLLFALLFARKQTASVRHTISLLTLLGLTLLPIAILASKSWAVYRLPLRSGVQPVATAMEVPQPAVVSRSAPIRSAIRDPEAASAVERSAPSRSARRKSDYSARAPAERMAPPTAIPPVAAVAPVSPAGTAPSAWRIALLAVAQIWLFGVTIQILRTALGFVTAWRWRRNSYVSADPQMERLTGEAALAVGLTHLPVVRVSTRASMPILIGLARPAVILPRQLVHQLDANALRQVLIHEFAHYHRCDAWIGLWFRLVAIPFWFHPLAYRLHQMLHDTREELCDSVVVQTQPPISYARTLLMIAESCRPRSLSTVGIGIVGMSLEMRVKRLLKPSEHSAMQKFPSSRVPLMIALLLLGLTSQVLIAVEPPAQTLGQNESKGSTPENCDELEKVDVPENKHSTTSHSQTRIEFTNTA